MRTTRRLAALLIVMLSGVGTAGAQPYPNHPVRVIGPFAAGGPTDLTARVIRQKLSERLGQQFVVENRPGAGGNIGLGIAAKAPPDGDTLRAVSSSFVVNP